MAYDKNYVYYVLGYFILLIIILALIIGILQFFISEKKTKQIDKIRMNQFSYAILIGISILTAIVLVAVIVLAVVRGQEQSKLFQPEVCTKYKTLSGVWCPLKHGGGLMHVMKREELQMDEQGNLDIRPKDEKTRRVFFIHGNSYNLEKYAVPLLKLKEMGYSVWALEFAYYGKAKGSSKQGTGGLPNAKTVVQDVIDAWKICGRSDTIVMGFSLGGAILGQVYEYFNPAPSQLVFLTTFCDFPELVADKIGEIGKMLAPMLQTQWRTKPPTKYKGQVMIVWTADDQVVPSSQGYELCTIFKNLHPRCIKLPSGGHRNSALIYQDRWANRETLLVPELY